MAFSDLWAEAIGAWVALSELLQTVQGVTGIPPKDASSLLRPQLEMCAVRAAVLGAPEVLSGEMSETSFIDVFNEPRWLSPADWLLVQWDTGRLHDHQVYILRADVMAVLDPSQFSGSPDWRDNRGPQGEVTSAGPVGAASLKSNSKHIVGGRPAKYDWEAFWIEVALYADLNDLKPEYRSELQSHMRDWCDKTWVSAPDDATIRARLQRLFGALQSARN